MEGRGKTSSTKRGERAARKSPPDQETEGGAALEGRLRILRLHNHLFEHAPVGLLVFDPSGKVVTANATMAEMLGVSARGALLRTPFERWILPSHRPLFAQHLQEVLRRSRSVATHLTLTTEDGSQLITRLVSVSRRGEDGLRLIHTSVSDDSARFDEASTFVRIRTKERAIEVDAMEHQRRFERAAIASAELSESLDLEATLRRTVGLGTAHVACYAAVDLAGEEGQVRRAAFAHRDGEAEDLPLDPYAPFGSARVIRTGRLELYPDVGRGELLGLVAGAAELRALRDRAGGYLCLPLRAHGRTIGAMTFVSPRWRRISPEDVALAEELSRHAALAIDNARLYREAQESDRHKDEFLAMLGHELRNPLAAVVTAARTMTRRADDGDAVRRTAEIVGRQGDRLVRLVDDLLDVSRVTRGKIALRHRRVDLDDLVARAVESTRPLVEERRHRLSVRSSVPVLVDADPARVEQVLVNLLANAAKYTPPGGHIAVEVLAVAGTAVVRVRDDGAGIPAADLHRIFSPFTQLGASPDRTDRGLGIGLTLARSLVELHGGHLDAHSEGPGRGSEFVVRLPLAPADAPPAEAEDPKLPPAPASGERRRVIVVEDHPDVAAMLKEELEMLGQDVRTADNGPEAVALAREVHPSLMLIDIGLPGMDGYQLATALRQEPSLEGATLVAVTGYGGPETTRKCREAGFDRHFTKPIREDMLIDLLRGA